MKDLSGLAAPSLGSLPVFPLRRGDIVSHWMFAQGSWVPDGGLTRIDPMTLIDIRVLPRCARGDELPDAYRFDPPAEHRAAV